MKKYYDALKKLGSIDLQCYDYDEENQEALTPLFLEECYKDDLMLISDLISDFILLKDDYKKLQKEYKELEETKNGIDVLTKFTIELNDEFKGHNGYDYSDIVVSVVARTKEEAFKKTLENTSQHHSSINRECKVLTFEDIIVGKVYHNEK